MADDAPKKRGRPKNSEAPKEIDWAEELGQQMDALATQQREASKFAADFLKKQQRIREANEKARQKAELAALKAEEDLAKAQIEEELKKTVETSKEVQQLLECIEKIKSISIRDTYVSIADLKKILAAMPVVKNSEINDHMKKCLKKDNVKWLVSGFYNQKDAQICPYCGQTIESREAKRFLKELQKFIASKMQIKAKEIIEDAKYECPGSNIKEVMVKEDLSLSYIKEN